MMNPADVIDFLTTRGREIILETYTPRSCIASTQVGLAVLKAHGVKAWPVACRVDVMNQRALQVQKGEMAEALGVYLGAKHLSIEGTGKLTMSPTTEWDGHLVIETKDSADRIVVIDLSLDQMARPENGIDLKATAFAPPDNGWPIAWEQGGITVLYRRIPSRAYRQARDWTHRDRWTPIVDRILQETQP